MPDSDTYEIMLQHLRELAALDQIGGILSWDQEVMMPPKGGEARGEQLAALENVAHERRTSPQLRDWLAELENHQLDTVQTANVRLAKRAYERAVKVPASLASELARVTSRAQSIWAKARKDNDFLAFKPELETVLSLKRQEADCLRTGGQTRYDALLDGFEPGMNVAVLQPLLEGLRPRLSTLIEASRTLKSPPPALVGAFPALKQMALARKFGDISGYDWEAGRLDLSVHPFSSGTGGDSRITTRVDPDNPLDCLYSTLHELGHSLYEQGMPKEHAFTPVAHHVSMGVHESQSRLWENQIGRSRAFCTWLMPHMRETFGDIGFSDARELYRAINRVETGFIRTDADEVHYNLHVLLRFELERELIAGELEVADLEAEWNRRFKRDFGIAVPDAARGVLQDVHWSVGLFGYFPTYALGNIYAAQLNDAMRAQLGDVDGAIAKGETGEVLAWLRRNIHEKGSLLEPAELIEQAAGAPLSSEPLLDYLNEKFAALFAMGKS